MIKKIYGKINSSRTYFVLFIVILTLLSSINIFRRGIIYGDDLNFHIHRIIGIVDNIRIKRYVPVYFNYLNGFGYGNGLFYPDIFLFIPALLNYIGIELFTSLKIFIIIINLISIYSMYLCVHKITKEKKCAYISMILYAIANYRLIDFTSRGSLGEMIAFAFIPLVILGLYYIFFDNEKKGYYLSIGLSCVCFSHVISFYLTTFTVVIFIILNIKQLKEKTRLKFLIFYVILAMLITSHFWLPMIEQLFLGKFNIGVNKKIYESIIPFYFILLDIPFNIVTDYYISGIGLIYYVSLIRYLKTIKQDKFLYTIMLLSTICTLLVCFKPIWKINLVYKLFSVIQFPWRFYIISTVLFIIGFSIIFKYIKFDKFARLSIIYLASIFSINSIIYSFDGCIDRPLTDEIMVGEYLPENFDRSIIYNYDNKKIEYEKNNNILNVKIIKKSESIELPLIYYKGYKACNDEKCYDVFKTDKGLVGVTLNNDVKDLKVWYEGTKIYKITKYTSIIGIAVLIYKIKKHS